MPAEAKRKHTRIPLTILIDIFTVGSTVSKGRACIVDLSLGGLAMETEAELEKGTKLFLKINLTGESEPLEVYAEVVRILQLGNLYHYGVRYTRFGSRYTKFGLIEKFLFRNHIRKWIKAQQKKMQ